MSGVKVAGDNTSLIIDGSKTPISTGSNTYISRKSSLSDFGLVGYSKKTGSTGAFVQELSQYYDSNDVSHGGVDFGGSVAFRAINMFIYRHFLTHDSNGYEKSTLATKTSTLNSNSNPSHGYDLELHYACYPTGNVVTTPNTNGNGYKYYMAPDSFNVNPENGSFLSSGKSALFFDLADNCYIPLKFAEQNEDDWENVATNNTGYVASGSESFRLGSTYLRRIANSYSDDYHSVSTCNGTNPAGDPYYSADLPLEIVSYSKNVSGGWCLVKDSHNQNHTPANPAISSMASNKKTPAELGFNGYDKARSELNESMLKEKRLNGLQFLKSNTDGSLPSMLNISQGLKILGKTNVDYQNYHVPKGFVDFNLVSSGQICLFAGSYNMSQKNSSMTFFSLYKVNRASNGTVSSLKRITEVYDNTNSSTNVQNPYVYKYYDNSYSDSHGNTPIMDVHASLETEIAVNASGSNSRNNLLYYFEIPVNAGEYALSLPPSGHIGTSLIYLDIGTNGSQGAANQVTGYSITTTSNGKLYPQGVDFAVVGTDIAKTGGLSFSLAIAPNQAGDIKFNVTNTNVAISGNTMLSHTYTFLGSKYASSADPPNKFTITDSIVVSEVPIQTSEKYKVSYISAIGTNGTRQLVTIKKFLVGSEETQYTLNGSGSSLSAIQTAIPLITNVVTASIDGLSTAITVQRDNDGVIAAFDCILRPLPWTTNPDYYYVTISPYPQGLRLGIIRNDTKYSMSINNPVSDPSIQGYYTPNITFTNNQAVYPNA